MPKQEQAMLTQIINAIKDITGFRFYFLVLVLFLGFTLFLFKDNLKQLTFKPQELQEVSNQAGLQVSLDHIKKEHPLITGYIFFLYQPKHDAYFKKMVTTDIELVKQNEYFNAMPLNAQKYLNYLLVEKEYALLEYTDTKAQAEIHTYNADYVLVYNVYVKETIGEIIFTFDVKPTPEEIQVLLKKLRPVKYFII